MSERRAGPHNSIVDVAGLAVGNAGDLRLKSGVTVVIPDEPAVASVHVMGGAPGTRDTDLLAPEQTVDRVDALVLSGGSAFGLDASGGVQAFLREQGRGFAVGDVRVPIVPGAILFDLLNGGNKDWARHPPYRELGYRAAVAATAEHLGLGSNGAGLGATTATLKGGLGSASLLLPNGVTVAALVAVNAVGSATVGDTGHFWAAPFEIGAEFGGFGLPAPMPPDAAIPRLKGAAGDAPVVGGNTTIAIVATDAVLTKSEAKRVAVMAHDGLARALFPAHTPFDGDLVFALATGRRMLTGGLPDLVRLGIGAADVLARAIARGVYEARPAQGDLVPAWRQQFSAT
ncbi:P1 family peptidase [Prosthecomicrobium sp. N25]|uniref:P1 family peptidase n=1 Tax=Prosthecomicrobium sp. N25 TaxID=3129254 RepID=UPI003076ABEB